jgi:hypothetical protein
VLKQLFWRQIARLAAVEDRLGAEVWPMGLRASGIGLACGVGTLGGLLAPLGLEEIIGAPSFLNPQATAASSILPATLFLAAWYALAGFVFWLFAMETRGRSIEEIDAVLAPAGLGR